MVVTTRVRLDRVASSTKNAQLASEVIVGDEIVAAEGYVLAVRILEDKSSYNTVEDLAGRMVSLRAGDVLAGTLGSRRALRGRTLEPCQALTGAALRDLSWVPQVYPA